MDIKTLSDLISVQAGAALILSPVVIGLVQVTKSLGLSSRFAPAMALLFGVGVSLLIGELPMVGVISGLIACGLYSGIKTTVTE